MIARVIGTDCPDNRHDDRLSVANDRLAIALTTALTIALTIADDRPDSHPDDR